MTKTAVKPAAIEPLTLFEKIVAILPLAAVIAFYAEARLLYVRDDYAQSVLSFLTQAGIAAEIIVKSRAN